MLVPYISTVIKHIKSHHEFRPNMYQDNIDIPFFATGPVSPRISKMELSLRIFQLFRNYKAHRKEHDAFIDLLLPYKTANAIS